MIGDREHTSRTRDLGAVWMGHGIDLAERMNALAGELDLEGHAHAAALIRGVLNCDYNPLPPTRPELTLPPLRSSVPPRAEPGA